MWVKATKDEAQRARTNGARVRFNSAGWNVWIEEGGDAHASGEVLHRREPDDTTSASDLTKEAEAVFRPLMVVGGKYVTSYQECECGEQYLVRDEHIRKSPRHKEWGRGNIEVPVPPQPLMSAYPVGVPTPKLEVGVNALCGRCKARDKKGLDYYPDPDSKPAHRYPCRACNGHGVRPNVGPG